MAFETEQGNVTRRDAAISALAAPAFVESAKALAHGHIENFPADVNAIKFNKEGSFIAEIQSAEAGSYTFDEGDEYSEDSELCTAQTYVHIWKPTVQAERFTSGRLSDDRMAAKQGSALARKFDATWLALFTGFTNAVTCESVATKDKLLDAQYTVHNALNLDERLHVVLGRKARNELRKEITNITAPAFSNEFMLQLVSRRPSAAGYVGDFADMGVFNTSGIPTSGGDNVQLVFHPMWAFGIGLDANGVYSRGVFKASEGLYTELSSWMFGNVIEWHDAAGCKYLSDS